MGCLLALASSVYASNHHTYPNNNQQDKATEVQDKKTENPDKSVQANYAGYCEIEIVNNSFKDVWVSGVYDDGTYLSPFSIYSFEQPHTISLYYSDYGYGYPYCHYGMNIYIETFGGYYVYSGYTTRETSIYIYPFMKDKVKAELVKHQ